MTGELSSEQRAGYREQFEKGAGCPHCGGLHLRACPRVRRLVFRRSDEVAEVEFWQSGMWPEDGIVWPEDVYDDEEADGSPEAQEASEAQEAG